MSFVRFVAVVGFLSLVSASVAHAQEPKLPVFSGSAPSSAGPVTYFEKERNVTAVDGVDVPKDAVGYRMDFSAKPRVRWVYTKTGSELKPSDARAGKVVRLEELSAEAREKLLRDSVLPTLDVPEAVRAEADKVVARLSHDLVNQPNPASLPDTVEDWSKDRLKTKASRLQALFELSKSPRIEWLTEKKVVWIGRCAVPGSFDREDAAAFPIFPEAMGAKTAFLSRFYDVATKKFVEGEPPRSYENYSASDVAKMADALFPHRGTFSSIQDIAEGAKSHAEFHSLVANRFGAKMRVRIRLLLIDNRERLTTETSVLLAHAQWHPISYCFFQDRWVFRQ